MANSSSEYIPNLDEATKGQGVLVDYSDVSSLRDLTTGDFYAVLRTRMVDYDTHSNMSGGSMMFPSLGEYGTGYETPNLNILIRTEHQDNPDGWQILVGIGKYVDSIRHNKDQTYYRVVTEGETVTRASKITRKVFAVTAEVQVLGDEPDEDVTIDRSLEISPMSPDDCKDLEAMLTSAVKRARVQPPKRVRASSLTE